MSGLSDCIGQSSPEEIDPLPGQYIIFQIVVVVESVDYVVVFVVVILMVVIVFKLRTEAYTSTLVTWDQNFKSHLNA